MARSLPNRKSVAKRLFGKKWRAPTRNGWKDPFPTSLLLRSEQPSKSSPLMMSESNSSKHSGSGATPILAVLKTNSKRNFTGASLTPTSILRLEFPAGGPIAVVSILCTDRRMNRITMILGVPTSPIPMSFPTQARLQRNDHVSFRGLVLSLHSRNRRKREAGICRPHHDRRIPPHDEPLRKGRLGRSSRRYDWMPRRGFDWAHL